MAVATPPAALSAGAVALPGARAPQDDPDDDDNDSAPKPMTGDSPSHETVNIKPDDAASKLGSTIVFPDDYKK